MMLLSYINFGFRSYCCQIFSMNSLERQTQYIHNKDPSTLKDINTSRLRIGIGVFHALIKSLGKKEANK